MHKSGSDGKFTSSIGFVLAAVGSAGVTPLNKKASSTATSA